MTDQDQPPPPDTTNNNETTKLETNNEPEPENEPSSTIASQDGKLYDTIDQFISMLGSNDHQPDSCSPPEIIDSVKNYADLYDVKIVEYETGSKKWIHLEENESDSFIESVDRTAKLLKSLSTFHADENYAVLINRVSGIQQRAMSFMEVEFKSILDDFTTSN
ncbi:exocyst subunit exo70 family protein C2 [Artemisia annua]|uniref:Exocyst subunit exo70 family protein C2 n=1 Tax=Artemisia annua TaxID=35608 RepID=A0A2U1M5D6_ARTAN|nr:exocyst subunit exo70 family protein C2 [Artemisia annua]